MLQGKALLRQVTPARGVAALIVLYLGLLWFSAAPKGNLHTGDTDNLVAGAYERFANYAADVSRASCHQNPHISPFTLARGAIPMVESREAVLP